jgi:hypothetical protein
MCYCSVYDECGRVALRQRDEERAPVASCESDPEAEFAL